MADISQVLAKLEELQQQLDSLRSLAIAPSQIVVKDLSEISQSAGLLTAGEFRVGNGRTPGNLFSGVRIGSVRYGDIDWDIVGVFKDRMMFGLRAEDGTASFSGGQGVIDDTGINLEGLLYGIKQTADVNGVIRIGKLEMFVPEGSLSPVFGMSYADDSYGDNLISNGSAETGDLTGWTDSGATFSAALNPGPDYKGKYSIHAAEVTNSTPVTLTIAGSRPVTAGERYNVSLFTKDTFIEIEVGCTQNVTIDQSNPDFPYATADPAYPTNMFLGAGYYLGQLEQRALLKFILPTDVTNLYSAELKYFIGKQGLTLGSTILSIYKFLRAWDWIDVCWNHYDGTIDWGTAGAKAASDISLTAIGTKSVVASSTLEDWYYTTLTTSAIQDWIDTPANNKGLLIAGGTLSGNNAVEFGMLENGLGASLVLTEKSKYKIEIKWWDGGSVLVRTDLICVDNGVSSWNERNSQLVVPDTAVSFTMVITAQKGKPFDMDNIVVKEITMATKFYMDPSPTIQDNYGTRRILTTARELQDPTVAPVAAIGGGGIDATTVSLIHFETAPASAIVDEKGKVWTKVGNANTVSGAGEQVFGSYGIHFDGAGDCISTPDSSDFEPAGSNFTFKLWVKLQTLGVNNGLFGKHTNTVYDEYAVYTNTANKLVFHATIGGASWDISLTSNTALDTNWHLVELIRYGNVYTWYLDGKADGSVTVAGNIRAAANIFKIGTDSTNDGHFIADDFSFSKYAEWTVNHPVPAVPVEDIVSNVENGDHSYVFTYYDATGDTLANPAVTLTQANNKTPIIFLTAGPAGTIGRRIYRSKAGTTSPLFLLADIPDNTSYNGVDGYVDNISDANLVEIVPPLVNLTSSRPQLPRQTYASSLSFVSNATLTITATGVSVQVGTTAANANDGDWFETSVWLSDGAYTLYVHGRVQTDAGKTDCYIDNVLQAGGTGTEWYAASAANAVKSFAVTIAGRGYHKLRFKINGKHASSSDYTFNIYSVTLASAVY